ncbi:hypothetical protein MYCTH_2054578 [Thermothelomyces thermophilus ATCC 42464]|uniref:Uncharacterized protein n=1 Tax=Thermothelomyces thermophilus (strain ATCC 42464 / BCRC 31852 / DSM 1799) TaxID=573729 RepID=G2Q4V1_THET4|nr:uncharacterized protein MYCTH_2054578 [Thermothelomyces thermophilus ATCC 42464]AEO55390.1 hypothetical protein MYCTH_2054578 [Thermothelomyces thermophilus ATCC 42464]
MLRIENRKGEKAQGEGRRKKKEKKTYNTEDSLVVTDPTTDSAITSLTKGERTGSRIFW